MASNVRHGWTLDPTERTQQVHVLIPRLQLWHRPHVPFVRLADCQFWMANRIFHDRHSRSIVVHHMVSLGVRHSGPSP
jgi:hypothetical protein